MDGDDAPEPKLTMRITSSSKISPKVLSESFGLDLLGKPKCEEVKSHSRLDLSRWLHTCTFDREQSLDSYLHAVDRFCKHFKESGYVDADVLLNDISDIIEMDHKYLYVDHFALGLWTDLDVFIKRFTSVIPRDSMIQLKKIQASFYHDRGYLEIYFRDEMRGSTSKFHPVYKLLVRYSDIKRIVVRRELRHKDAFYDDKHKREPMDVYLHVSTVSVFRWSLAECAYENFFEGPWTRQASFGTSESVTRCNDVGKNRVLKFKLQHKGVQDADAIYSLFRASRAPVVFANVKCVDIPKNFQPLPRERLPDELQYAIQCIQSVAPELPTQVHMKNTRKEIQTMLEHFAKENEAALLDSIYEIYYEAKKGLILDLKSAIENSFKYTCQANQGGHRSGITQDSLPPELCLVKKATLCLSNVVFEPPTIVQTSPLLQECDLGCLLLVDIRDDDYTNIATETGVEAWDLVERLIKVKIQKGLKVGQKKFTFLGASKAQFREHCFWMYADDKDGNGTEQLLNRLGVCGTLTSRMKSLNALLTEVIGIVTIDPTWAEEDASSADTDFNRGLGRISQRALDYICEACGLERTTALRVVHGNYVGTIVLDPDLKESRIIYRKSQRILNCGGDILHVVATAECEPALLDRVFLSTLSSIQKDHSLLFSPDKFENLVTATLTESAAPFRDASFDLVPKIEEVLPHLPVFSAERRNYDVRADVLFRQALRCNQLKRMRDLKELRLRMPRAFRLMPVVDEYGVLEEGQIYARVTDMDGDVKVITGLGMVVARKDAMHTSEIRRFEAVETGPATDKLKHLIDCVVFSAKGAVPPLKYFCANGDFADDSDVILIANEEFQLRSHSCDEPKDQENLLVNETPSENKNLLNHYFDCLRYAAANNISDVFCALSDCLPAGAHSKACAKICAIRDQLDKFYWGTSGRPESLQPLAAYPDFLGRISDKKTYCSKKALGACYRRMRLIDVEGVTSRGLCNLHLESSKTEQNVRLSEIEGNEEFKKEAAKAMATWMKRIKSIEAVFGLTTEEVLTGTIFTLPEAVCPSSRISRLESVMRCYLCHVSLLTTRQFARGGMDTMPPSKRALKMSAYIAHAIDNPADGGYALPWLLPDEMMTLITEADLTVPISQDDSVQKFLLKKMRDTDQLFDLQMRIQDRIFRLIQRWIKKHLDMLALARDDKVVVEDFLTNLAESAYNQAWDDVGLERKTGPYERRNECFNKIVNDPQVSVQLLASTLSETNSPHTDKETTSKHKFLRMLLKAFLCNILVKAAAYGSLAPLLEAKSIIRSKIVSGTFLLPLTDSATDTKYIRYTQGDLTNFCRKLQEFSLCKKVAVTLIPQGDDETPFEQVFAEGEWFAVENLKTIMLMPDFRKVICSQLEDKYKVSYYEHQEHADAHYNPELY